MVYDYISLTIQVKLNAVVGGDGLVAARHLWHYGYEPVMYYPKQSKNELYQVMINTTVLLFNNGDC